MRILHTSDWHLGRIFHGLHLTADQAQVLAQLTQLIQTEHIDVVLVAGDIYDRAVPPTEAVELLDRTLSHWLNDLKVPVIMIAGNHDNPQRLGFGTELFAAQQLYIVGPAATSTAPIVLEDEYGAVYFAPLTYCEPLTASLLSGQRLTNHEQALQWQIEQQLAQIPAEARKVALAHAFLTGASTCEDSERPLSIGGSTTVSLACFEAFNYTALGHLHACQACSPSVRYSGSLLKYSFNEATQKKGVHIIDLAADGSIDVQTHYLQAEHELTCLTGSFEELMESPRTELRDHYLQVTLTDSAPILDAKNRLETHYPNILQLGYARLQLDSSLDTERPANPKLTPLELFSSFFQALQDRPLSAEEEALLQQTLTQIDTAERSN